MDQNVILNLNTDNYSIQFPLHTRFIQSYTSNTRRPSLETTSTHNLLQLNWSTNSTSKTIWCPNLFTIFIYITLQKFHPSCWVHVKHHQAIGSRVEDDGRLAHAGLNCSPAATDGYQSCKILTKKSHFSHETKLLNLLHDNLWTSYNNSIYIIHYFSLFV